MVLLGELVLFPSKKRGVNVIDGVCIYNNEYTANRQKKDERRISLISLIGWISWISLISLIGWIGSIGSIS